MTLNICTEELGFSLPRVWSYPNCTKCYTFGYEIEDTILITWITMCDLKNLDPMIYALESGSYANFPMSTIF